MSRRNKIRRFQEPPTLTNAFRRVYRADALRDQGGACKYCFEPMTLQTATADHVDPRHGGGLDRRGNIVAACKPCNRAKGHMPVKTFLVLLAAPTPTRGMPIACLLAWSRRRINARLALMERRLAIATGRARP